MPAQGKQRKLLPLKDPDEIIKQLIAHRDRYALAALHCISQPTSEMWAT